MTYRVTIKTANEWKALAGKMSVTEIAKLYGTYDSTVYYHINRRHAERRREQWRRCQQRRRAEARHVTSQ
jgi:hypothetical protein